MNQYELTVILNAHLTDKDDVLKSLEANFSKIIKKDEQGKFDLAYPIKKETVGEYVFYIIEANDDSIREVNYLTKVNDKKFLRHLFVKVD